MKKILLLPIAVWASSQLTHAQKKQYDWKNMKPEQRKEIIRKMDPQEKMSLLKQFRENMMVSALEIPQIHQPEFKTLYAEYQEKQNSIKNRFRISENYDNLSDEEAKKQLNESFEIGQQLLDNRKIYAEKFLKVLKPQQVLQMYHTEGKMRSKILDKKQDRHSSSPQSRRP